MRALPLPTVNARPNSALLRYYRASHLPRPRQLARLHINTPLFWLTAKRQTISFSRVLGTENLFNLGDGIWRGGGGGGEPGGL